MKKLGEIFLIKLVKFEKSWRIMGGGPLKNKGGFAPPEGGRVVPWSVSRYCPFTLGKSAIQEKYATGICLKLNNSLRSTLHVSF